MVHRAPAGKFLRIELRVMQIREVGDCSWDVDF
jgi:hypothetical protein